MLPTAGQLCWQLPVPPIALDLNDKLRAFIYLFIFHKKKNKKTEFVWIFHENLLLFFLPYKHI